jgi:hypothetical protein
MRNPKGSCREETLEPVLADFQRLKRVVTELRDKALFDAKAHLHPLLHNEELDKLDSRSEFVQKEPEAMGKVATERFSSLSAQLAHLAREYANVDLGRHTTRKNSA